MKNLPVDWDVIRDVSYNSNKKTIEDFLGYPELAFLFCCFAKSVQAGKFDLEEVGKFVQKKVKKSVQMEVCKLAKEAKRQLEKSEHSLKQEFINYLDKWVNSEA